MQQLNKFLQQMSTVRRGRLIFALDATMSSTTDMGSSGRAAG